MNFLFENLEVYQRAVDFAERITVLTKTFPTQGHYHLVDQLRRASPAFSGGNNATHLQELKM
jgi:four helix bundle protein